MTPQSILTYNRQNEAIRYPQAAMPFQSDKTTVKILQAGITNVQFIKLGADFGTPVQESRPAKSEPFEFMIGRGAGIRPKSSERFQQGNYLANLPGVVPVADVIEAHRMMRVRGVQAHHDWRSLAAEELLAWINNPRLTPHDREMAVLFAETTVFDDSLRPRLLTELADFIGRNRFTRNGSRITAVASAVRKYAMNMAESDFEQFGAWLRPSDTETVGSRVELELLKGLCWRLSYVRVSPAVMCTGLVAALFAVGNAYLLPRWIVEKNYAASALHAIAAVAILQGLSGDRTVILAMLERVSALGLQWFSELLDDRLHETCEAIGQHDAQLAERLRQFIESAR